MSTHSGMVTVLTLRGQERIVRLLGSPGPRGPAGADGADGIGAVSPHTFAWGDATPTLVATIGAGQRAFSVQLAIETAFNGSGAQITVGTVSDPDALMSATANAPGEVAVFETNPNVHYLADTGIYLTINPGSGASQGAGALVLQLLS